MPQTKSIKEEGLFKVNVYITLKSPSSFKACVNQTELEI